ncbi:cytochrome b [Salinisphaera shabanensis T35B1]|jgi:ubiquinol-cytochrome c reductase cytochrome b subunit|uniref:Cytochrome b n=1 Tax=Salinisphaera shabanensis E1L3A TaxID=1033802 RepID=U2FXQ6_9GAMM|nr:cytochrome bc complex cytochrome b subunit [Salinisphaera shabanensis]ERJ20604.1 ubiquinol-cytochrome c reductase cytochrome b subunit protein [Salinisphaera shabanensis E1L3A]
MASKFMNWVDARFPATQLWNEHIGQYYAPKNFNVWYYFGSLAMLVLANQLLTGIWLAMFYKPSAAEAFGSVAYIMRDVEWGWLIRYMHSTGASFFFIVVYLHMFRALLYGSYRKPRELLWIFGCLIFLALMAEAFMGYVLPWGNMSYWGAQVIISLFSAIPVIGEQLTTWIRGDFVIGDATLNRFFALHVVALPFVLVGLVIAHIMALHHVGSNNPDGIEIKANKNADGHPADGIPFHPYYTVKDLFGVGVFLILFCGVIFFAPEFGGFFLEPPNFTEANPSVTPEHIAPVWYFTPFYAMLRAINFEVLGVPAKLLGVITMFGAVLIMFVLPWLDRSKVKSIRYKGWIFKAMLAAFVVAFVILGYIGTQAPSPLLTTIAQVCTAVYFAFFLLMPFYSVIDRTKPVPERVTG